MGAPMQSLGQLSYLLSGTWGPHWCHPNPTSMCFSTARPAPPPSVPSSPITVPPAEGEKPGHTFRWKVLGLPGRSPPESQPDHMAKWGCQWGWRASCHGGSKGLEPLNAGLLSGPPHAHSQGLLPCRPASLCGLARGAGTALTPSLAAEANLLAPVVRLLQPCREAEATSRPHGCQVAPHRLLPKEA